MSGGDWKRGVAILGRAGAGKTTLADALVLAGVCDMRASFAAELKQDLGALGVEKGQPYARDMMIAYGQNRRALDPDYWINRLAARLHDDFDGLAIDDVRFPNEVAFLRDRGFLVVRVFAAGNIRMDRGIPLGFVVTEDASETALDHEPVDLQLNTGGPSPGECAAEVAAAMRPVAA